MTNYLMTSPRGELQAKRSITYLERITLLELRVILRVLLTSGYSLAGTNTLFCIVTVLPEGDGSSSGRLLF